MLAGRRGHNDAPAKLNAVWPNEVWVGGGSVGHLIQNKYSSEYKEKQIVGRDSVGNVRIDAYTVCAMWNLLIARVVMSISLGAAEAEWSRRL